MSFFQMRQCFRQFPFADKKSRQLGLQVYRVGVAFNSLFIGINSILQVTAKEVILRR